jgi:hypothetical protein
MFRSFLALAIALGTMAASGQAQTDSTKLTAGMKLRIHQQQTGPIVGTLISLDPDHVVLLVSAADTTVVPRGSITKVEMYQGMKSGAGKGAVTGLLIGGIGGAILGGIAAASQDESDWTYIPPGQLIIGGAVGWGALGAGIGALIGMGSHSEKWEPTVLPTVKVVSDESKGRRVKLGMRISF